MSHSVTAPTAAQTLAAGALEVHQVPAWTDNFIWLIVSPALKEAAAVDGPEAAPALRLCEKLGVRLTTILNTHTHLDHIGINHSLHGHADLRVVGPKSRAAEIPGITEPVGEGDEFDLFGVPVRVLLTEGHIDGHISFVVDGGVFCGDTMFGAGCGYLFDGPPRKMYESLQRLAALPGDTRVYCAHEYTQDNLRFAWSVEPDNPALAARIQSAWRTRAEGRSTVPSTIALERNTNPFLRPFSKTLMSRVSEALPNHPMGNPTEVFTATRALKDAKNYKRLGDEVLPLR